MKKIVYIFLMSISIAVCIPKVAHATLYQSSGSGNFSGTFVWSVFDYQLNTWLGSNQPFFYSPFVQTNDTIVIMAGDSIYLDADISILGQQAIFEVYGTLNANTHYVNGQPYDNQNQIYGSNFYLRNGGTLITAHPHGTACIQNFAVRLFEDNANYEFNGNYFNFDPQSSNYNNPQHMFDFYKSELRVGTITINTVDSNQKVIPNLNSLCHNYKINDRIVMKNGQLKFSNDTINYAGAEPIFKNANGVDFLGPSKLKMDSTCVLKVTSQVFASFGLGANISKLAKLEVGVCNTCEVKMNADLSLEAYNGLVLQNGKLNMDGHSVKLLFGSVQGADNGNYVIGKLIQRVSTLSTTNYEFFNFPIGDTSAYKPIGFSAATIQGLFVSAKLVSETPIGTGDDSSVSVNLSNMYWVLKNESQTQFSPNNYISGIGFLELQPSNLLPTLSLSQSIIALSNNNTIGSFTGINSSVSPPYINSFPLTYAQSSQLSTADGLFVTIGRRTLKAGVYCIGPSNSYTPPAGSNYVYENANDPYGNISEALADIQSKGSSGHVTFEIQNNYTGYTAPPANLYEANPITISYQGTADRTLNIRVRSDLNSPLTIINVRPNGNPNGLLSFIQAKYVTINGNMNASSCSITKGLRVINNGADSWNTNCVSFDGAENCGIYGLQLERDYGNGVALNCNVGIGNKNITIECNKIIPRNPIVQAGMSIRNGNGVNSIFNENIYIKKNYFENAQYNVYIGNSNARGLWEIAENHFYRPTGQPAGIFFGLNINDTATVRVNNNYFGGTAPFCGGGKMNFYGMGTSSVSMSANSINSSEFIGNHIENMEDNTSDPTGNLQFFSFYNSGYKIEDNVFGNPNVAQDIRSLTRLNFTGFYVSQNFTTPSITSVSGNTFSNIYFSNLATCSNGTGCGGFYPIYLYRTGNGGSTITQVNNNQLKHIYTGAGYGVSMIYSIGIGTLHQVRNNVIEDINLASTVSKQISLITVSGENLEVVNNRIGSLTTSNDVILNGGTVLPFSVNGTSGSLRFDSNTVSNTFIASNSSSSRCMFVAGGSAIPLSFSFNKILNVTYDMSIVSLSNLFGMYFSSVSTLQKSVNNNTIHGYHQINPTTVGPINMTGLYLGTANNVVAQNSKIYDITNACLYNASVPKVIGIQIANSGIILSNSMVSLGENITNPMVLYGVSNETAYNTKLKHNTIYIGGINTGNSYAYYKQSPQSGVSGDTLMNNIFFNNRTGGGNNYAIFRNANFSYGDIGVCNYNDLYSTNPTTLGKWNTSVGNLTFTQWQTASSGDANSKNVPVQFINPISNLHIDPNANCNLDGSADNEVGISNDIDGQIRNTLLPDIGADEFTYTPTWASIGSNSPVCGGSVGNIELQAMATSIAPYTYLWTGPNSFTSTLPNPVILNPNTITHEGNYEVTITDALGCSATFVALVLVLDTPQNWYLDVDQDGYYTGSPVLSCSEPGPGYTISTLGGNDCDDANANIHPNAPEICGNNIDDDCNGLIDDNCFSPFHVKAFIEGYYTGSQTMASVLANQGETLNTSICDSVLVELKSNPFAQAAYSQVLPISTSGIINLYVPLNIVGTQKYIILKHRNSVETWSAISPIINANSTYDFSMNNFAAYGNNMIEVESGVWALYSGDCTQDGSIDIFDFLNWDIDNQAFSSGYFSTDLNGDGSVDIFDFLLWDTNNQNFVEVIMP
ncbi:MAG: MopE-related protein [Chitinophagaceae bacterium]